MKCLKCGAENSLDAKFCGGCGNNLEEQQRAYLREQERLAREQKEKQERLDATRRKQLELRREWVRRNKAAIVGVSVMLLLCSLGGGGYWYYQKQETAKAMAAERQREAEQRAKVEAVYNEWLKGPEWQRGPGGRIWKSKEVLFRAINEDRTDIAEFAISKGADVNSGTDDEAGPFIFHASSVKMLESLLAKGANLNLSSPFGWGGNWATGAVRAKRSLAVIEFLLAKGVSVDAKDVKGNTPLALARNQRNSLEQAIAEARSKNPDAFKEGDELLKYSDAVIGLLLKYGAKT